MAAFYVEKTFYLAAQDALLLAGHMVSGRLGPDMAVDLPHEIKGPGWVPIGGTQTVPFADGRNLLCLILDYQLLTGCPFMEFADLHGKTLDLRTLPAGFG